MHLADNRLFSMLSNSRAALVAKVLMNRTRYITFVLDGVYGAHNLAAIARSCDAWGVQDLHIVEQTEECHQKVQNVKEKTGEHRMSILQRFKHEPSVQNVSKNCHKWLTIREYGSAQLCLEQLRSEGYKIIVSSLSSDAKSIHEVDLSEKCAFVFGNEKNGVTKEMQSQADGFFTVPMMGFVESMNVSVAVGTTACLVITRCRESVFSAKYYLSSEEKRELVSVWLKNRFSSNQSPKLLHTSRDVTKLGYKCETCIVKNGMFTNVQDDSLPSEEYWKLALRLTGNEGRRVVTDFTRRKVGVLSDIGFQKRSLSLSAFIAGFHALTCEAALVQSGSLSLSRQALNRYFVAVCKAVSAEYEPYFDQHGVPNLPVHAVEFHQTFKRLETAALGPCRAICLETAEAIFGMDARTVESLVSEAGIQHIAQCISNTVRCVQRHNDELFDVVRDAEKHFKSLQHLLAERYPDRAWHATDSFYIVPRNHDNASQFQFQCDVLQVLLRLSNAAMLCSEVYQTIWDRHVHNKKAVRVHSFSFSLLEPLLSDSYAEMLLLNAPHSTALFRGVLEWEQVLQRLKSYFRNGR